MEGGREGERERERRRENEKEEKERKKKETDSSHTQIRLDIFVVVVWKWVILCFLQVTLVLSTKSGVDFDLWWCERNVVFEAQVFLSSEFFCKVEEWPLVVDVTLGRYLIVLQVFLSVECDLRGAVA